MTTLRQAAEMALEIMDLIHPDFICSVVHHSKQNRHKAFVEKCPITMQFNEAKSALSQALAEPEWVELTDEDVLKCFGLVKYLDLKTKSVEMSDFEKSFARAVEAKLKEKNT
jgi:hypothetical protein